jgi:translation initiation factor IF-1
MYSVILDGGMKVQAKPKGKLIKSRIKIVMGDKVQVELNEIDPTKGYIIYRL